MIHKIACLTDPFARVAKAVLDDSRISWKAKGVFAYLMSKPDNWKGVVADVVNHGPDGETLVRAAMGELEEHGYAKQERVREAGRMAGLIWHVSDDPSYFKSGKPHKGKLAVVNPDAGKAESEKPPLSKKEKKKKKDLSDSEWIESLKASPAYEGIDIDREYAKMIHWCETKRKHPSRPRFINWLNKCEVPMTAAPKLPPGVVRGQKPPPVSQAKGWDPERFKQRIGGSND